MVTGRTRGTGGAGARQCSWLFIVAGLIGLATDALPGTLNQAKLLAVGLDAAVVAVGVVARYVPWARWNPRAVLVLPVLALADLSLNIGQGFLPISTYGIWLVLVFVWIGQWQPPLTAIAMGPVAAAAYCAPFLFGTPVEPTALGAIVLSVLVAVLVGETIARKERATQAAQVGQREALTLLAEASLTDDLTGLGNRRKANALLDSLRAGDALAILDLDHFKQVNDNLGHLTGDHVLQDLGAYLKGAVRGADDVARFGGEEFVVVLRAAGPSAPDTVRRLLAGWRATIPVTTLSAGLAVHESGRASDVTFAEADAALYDAKHDGRDRLVVHPPNARTSVAAAPLMTARLPDVGVSEGRVLRVLLGLAAINGLVCIVAPGWVVLRHGGPQALVGNVIYVAAVAVLALTPLQLMFLWFVVGGRLREMRANKLALQRIRDVLGTESIDTAFQPIFDLASRRVIGVEALARFTTEPATTPDTWFADADRLGCGLDLELLAIRTHLANVADLPADLYVALNVSPATMAHPRLLATLKASPVATERLVLEVTEHTSIPDYAPFQEARANLRHHGIMLAVDDAGSGYASLRHIVALAPDLIKLDRALVSGIDHDEARRAMVAAVVMYARQAGAVLVAEGVETAAELTAIEVLGVEAAQGFHLGRPTTCRLDWARWERPALAARSMSTQ